MWAFACDANQDQDGTALAPLLPHGILNAHPRVSPHPGKLASTLLSRPCYPHSTSRPGKRVLQVLQPDLIGARPCRATNKALIMSHSSSAQTCDLAFLTQPIPIPHPQSNSRPLTDHQTSILSHPHRKLISHPRLRCVYCSPTLEPSTTVERILHVLLRDEHTALSRLAAFPPWRAFEP